MGVQYYIRQSRAEQSDLHPFTLVETSEVLIPPAQTSRFKSKERMNEFKAAELMSLLAGLYR